VSPLLVTSRSFQIYVGDVLCSKQLHETSSGHISTIFDIVLQSCYLRQLFLLRNDDQDEKLNTY
jgi:hypothetical protein